MVFIGFVGLLFVSGVASFSEEVDMDSTACCRLAEALTKAGGRKASDVLGNSSTNRQKHNNISCIQGSILSRGMIL